MNRDLLVMGVSFSIVLILAVVLIMMNTQKISDLSERVKTLEQNA